MIIAGRLRCRTPVPLPGQSQSWPARASLTAVERRLSGAFTEMRDIVIMTEARRAADGRIEDFLYVYLNPAGYRMMGRGPEEILGHGLLELFPSHLESGYFDIYVDAVETGERRDFVIPTFDENGVQGSFEVSVWRVGDGYILVGHDITANLAHEEALMQSEQRYRLLAENASDLVFQLDPQGVCLWASESLTSVLGWQPGEVLGHPAADFVHPEEMAKLASQVVATPAGATTSVECRLRCADGRYRWFAATLRATTGPTGQPDGFAGGAIGIGELKAMAEELAHAATHDGLTGLPNRTMLMQAAQAALGEVSTQVTPEQADQQCALLMVGLDNFKLVNDSLGHTFGDEVLRVAAARIAAWAPPGCLVTRFGGDELAVLLTGLTGPAQATDTAADLVARCREPLATTRRHVVLTVSVGVALQAGGGVSCATPEDLVRGADAAMFAAKQAGRDRVVLYNAELAQSVADRARIEWELRGALTRGELEVWFQPEIELASGLVCAAEALLRWRRPDGVVLPAADFIGVAEQSGLILQIGEWVMRQACTAAAAWATAPDLPAVVVRINLSAVQLSEPGLLGALDRALALGPVDRGLVCVEITETSFLAESPTVHENLLGIASRGLRIAIDDFGTGYGSLAYLQRYPINVLKVDRSFITEIAHNKFDHDLVAGLVALADRLGMSVTAEGIETSDQAEIVKELGCTGAQGYLYSPAVPQDELTAYLGGATAPCPAGS